MNIAVEREAMTGTDTQGIQVIGMELWDRYVMREDPTEADQVLMTVLAELEADLHHMNVGSSFGLNQRSMLLFLDLGPISDRTRILDLCYAFLSNLHHSKRVTFL